MKKKYRAIKRGFIDRTYEIGDTFEYDGEPGSWMEEVKTEPAKVEAPVKTPKKQAKTESKE